MYSDMPISDGLDEEVEAPAVPRLSTKRDSGDCMSTCWASGEVSDTSTFIGWSFAVVY